MNIGIIVRSLRIGGMERVAANLSDAFQKHGHSTTLIYLKNKPIQIHPENKKTDIRLINLDNILLKTKIGFFWIILSRFLNIFFRKSLFIWFGLAYSIIFKKEIIKLEKEKGHFDLLILRGQGTFELLWNVKDKRVIQVCENIFSETYPPIFESFYTRLLFNNKNIACVSQGVLEDFIKVQNKNILKPLCIKVITNPIDKEIIQSKSHISLRNIPDTHYLLGLGRIVNQKNFPLLIKAYKILKKKYSIEQKLVIVGDGKAKQEIVALTKKLGLEPYIDFPGSTTVPYAWMANADLFILSSNFEGLGMVILESFASGTNVVATNSPGGVKDIMSTGVLSNQLSDLTPENLAETIHSTLQKPFPTEDVNTVLKKFHPETITRQFIHFAESRHGCDDF